MAADLNIDCSGSSTTCSQSGLDPLFSSSLDGFWYPGKSITKTLNLKNSGSQTRKMAIKGKKTSAVSVLEKMMQISIVGGTTVIWSGSVADFYNQEKIEMGTFNPGANLDYNFTVLMSSGIGDEYQNQETVFDLTLGFWGEPIPTSGVLGEKTPGELGGASSTDGFVAGTQTEPLRWWWLILPGVGVIIIFSGSFLIKFFLKGGEK